MARSNSIDTGPLFDDQLVYLKLPFIRENYESLADTAAKENWSHGQYLQALIRGESDIRKDKAVQRRISLARFPVVKTLDQFNWSWPKKINREQVRYLAGMQFVEKKKNVILLGGVGVGKTHLATAISYIACLKGYRVLFTTAIDVINALIAAQNAGKFQQELKKYIKPSLLVLDELGYLPIDKTGADLLFQVISHRYERGAMIITSNRPFKDWAEIFNNDSMLASAILDRVLHHSDTVVIEGTSYRMKKKVDTEL